MGFQQIGAERQQGIVKPGHVDPAPLQLFDVVHRVQEFVVKFHERVALKLIGSVDVAPALPFRTAGFVGGDREVGDGAGHTRGLSVAVLA